MDIVQKLDELAELQAAARVTQMDYDAKRTEILTTVKDELDALDVEYKPLLSIAQDLAAQVESEIKSAVIANAASVKGTRLHAVYNKGRVTWDGKKLDGMMSIIPALSDARKEGEPSVTIRASK